MPLVVQKFGGTSVGDADRIRAVADHVARTRRSGTDVVVVVSAMGMGVVRKQFFPASDRPELIVEVYRAHGTGIAATTQSVEKVEAWLRRRPEARVVSS